MGATQLTIPQLRAMHVNRWLAVPRFNEAKPIGGRTLFQTTNFRLEIKPDGGQVPTGVYPSRDKALAPEDHSEVRKQPMVKTHLVRMQDLAGVGADPKQVMSDLVSCGWVSAQGRISDSFFGLTDASKMNLPASYGPVAGNIFELLRAARDNYYILCSDIIIGAKRADNPIRLFRTTDGIFSKDMHPSIHDIWTGKGGSLRFDLLRHILSVEQTSMDTEKAVGVMNAWFKDTNHCPFWIQPDQPHIYHAYDFELVQGDRSGMEPHTDQNIGANIMRTHHFKLAPGFLADIVKGLQDIGNTIGKRVNVKLPEGSQSRPWNYSSQVELMLSVLEHANFGTPKIQQDGGAV